MPEATEYPPRTLTAVLARTLPHVLFVCLIGELLARMPFSARQPSLLFCLRPRSQVGTGTDEKPVTARPAARQQRPAWAVSAAAEARGEGRHRLHIPAPVYTLRLDPKQVEPGESLLTVVLQRRAGVPEGDGRMLPVNSQSESLDEEAAEPAGLAAASSGAQLAGRAVRSMPKQRPTGLAGGWMVVPLSSLAVHHAFSHRQTATLGKPAHGSAQPAAGVCTLLTVCQPADAPRQYVCTCYRCYKHLVLFYYLGVMRCTTRAAGRLSLSFEEPLSLRSSAAPAGVVDAMAAALSTDLASGSASAAADSGLMVPWRPKGILVSTLASLRIPAWHVPAEQTNLFQGCSHYGPTAVNISCLCRGWPPAMAVHGAKSCCRSANAPAHTSRTVGYLTLHLAYFLLMTAS